MGNLKLCIDPLLVASIKEAYEANNLDESTDGQQ